MPAESQRSHPGAGRAHLNLAPPADGPPVGGDDADPGDSPSTVGEIVYGLLRLAGLEVALPLSGLREIVPCPASFAALPTPAAGLLGAMQLRTQIIPVLDLRCHLTDTPSGADDDTSTTDSIVAVVTDGSRMVGVLADLLRAVVVVPVAELIGLETMAGTQQELYSATFRHDVPGGIVSVLNVPSILALPQVPTVADPTQALRQVTREAHSGDRTTSDHTLLRCGPHVLAVPIGQVHTTLPAVPTEPSLLQGDLCLGVRDYGELKVPVVDPLVLLGLGSLPPDEPTPGLVLKLAGGFVVVAINALVDIVDIPPDVVAPVPALAFSRAELLAGVAQGELGRGSLVLDGEALAADPALDDLSRLNTRIDGADVTPSSLAGGPAPEGAAGTLGASHLVYDIGVDLATPLEQIRSILPMTTAPTSTDVGGAVLGYVSHQGAVVPVLSLITLLGRSHLSPDGPGAEHYALLVETGDATCVAFAVTGLRAIEPLVWQGADDPTASGDLGLAAPGDPAELLRTSPLIKVADNPRHLPQLDLRAVAATL